MRNLQSKNDKILRVFSKDVFDDYKLKRYLAPITYYKYKRAVESGQELSVDMANTIARAMKRWATSKGVTHFTHWFFPLNGVTAEKHDSFLEFDGKKPITAFSGKTLIKGEPDASSFPSGNLRSTFEARGYTVWDYSSSAFIKDDTLYIPTAFCSFGGEALDEKTPLLRSVQELSKWTRRILSLFNHNVKKVQINVGVEQEYFLIDKRYYDRRLDLQTCGRALFGNTYLASKGHYFASLDNRVAEFMKDVDNTLWRMGVRAKTEHNEVAPHQHELALIYSPCNLALDYNHIVMTTLKEVARKHDLECVLYEKPFADLNGSGKHNNWSINVDGKNVFDKSGDCLEFLLFMIAVVSAVDDYQDLIASSVASYSNDLRLGGQEAPPKILSLYIGKDVEDMIESIDKESATDICHTLDIGVKSLSKIVRDNNDRNRTSPIAFTSNKFELRMLGSMQSIGFANTVLNCAVASELQKFYNQLLGVSDIRDCAKDLIAREYARHKRIVYSGNNYSSEWKSEAKRRGLSDYQSCVDNISHLIDDKNIALFEDLGVLLRRELQARYEVMISSYIDTVDKELKTLLTLLNKEIIPSIIRYKGAIVNNESKLSSLDNANNFSIEKDIVDNLNVISGLMQNEKLVIENYISYANNITNNLQKATYYKNNVIQCIDKLSKAITMAEEIIPKEYWDMPSCLDMLL